MRRSRRRPRRRAAAPIAFSIWSWVPLGLGLVVGASWRRRTRRRKSVPARRNLDGFVCRTPELRVDRAGFPDPLRGGAELGRVTACEGAPQDAGPGVPDHIGDARPNDLARLMGSPSSWRPPGACEGRERPPSGGLQEALELCLRRLELAGDLTTFPGAEDGGQLGPEFLDVDLEGEAGASGSGGGGVRHRASPLSAWDRPSRDGDPETGGGGARTPQEPKRSGGAGGKGFLTREEPPAGWWGRKLSLRLAGDDAACWVRA